MTTLPAPHSSKQRCVGRERVIFVSRAAILLFGVCVILAVLEQLASDFYYLDQPSPAYVVAAFLGDVVWLFIVLGTALVAGVISLVGMVWIGAYIGARWEEVRDQQDRMRR